MKEKNLLHFFWSCFQTNNIKKKYKKNQQFLISYPRTSYCLNNSATFNYLTIFHILFNLYFTTKFQSFRKSPDKQSNFLNFNLITSKLLKTTYFFLNSAHKISYRTSLCFGPGVRHPWLQSNIAARIPSVTKVSSLTNNL